MPDSATIKLPGAVIQFVDGKAPSAAKSGCRELGIQRLLVAGTRNARTRYAHVWSSLEPFTTARFFRAEPHCPETVVESCTEAFLSGGCDGVLVIGGGSTIGLGKSLAVSHKAKFIAMPTTCSGSEMTPIYGRKIGSEKKTDVSEACRPDIVIYDSSLSVALPAPFTVASAFNSIAHAAEALYPRTANPIAAVLAKECLQSHKAGLELLTPGGNEQEARRSLLYGACLGGLAIGMTGIALHHQLCHVIGGLFNLPHCESNCAVLPQALDYNRKHIGDADREIAGIFGGNRAGQAIFDFAKKLDAPQSLGALGMPAVGVESVVNAMLSDPGYNPRPLEEPALRRTVQNAFEGNRPN